jgi:hypothetical protein
MRWIFPSLGALFLVLAFQRAKVHHKWIALASALAVLAGGYLMGLGTEDLILSLEARRWPTVQGVVLNSWVEEKWSRRGPYYVPRVEYRYTYGGKTYTSRRIWTGGRWESSNPSGAQKIVSQYRPGLPLRVYVRPGDPAFSVLETGVAIPVMMWFVVGLGILVAGLMVLALGMWELSPYYPLAWNTILGVALFPVGFLYPMDWVYGLPGAIGLVLLGMGAITLLPHRLGKSIRIEVDQPLVLGEILRARISFPRRTFQGLQVRLSCYKKFKGLGQGIWPNRLWFSEQAFLPHQVSFSGRGFYLETQFVLPNTLPEPLTPSGEPSRPLSKSLVPPKVTVTWLLEVRVKHPPMDARKGCLLQATPSATQNQQHQAAQGNA